MHLLSGSGSILSDMIVVMLSYGTKKTADDDIEEKNA